MQTVKINNITELKTRKGSEGAIAEVLGYYTSGDGGGGTFYWNNSSTTTDNGGVIIQVTGVTTGRWIKIIKSLDISAKEFGAKGDGITDDRPKLKVWLDYCADNGYKAVGTIGNYLVGNVLKVKSNTWLDGKGMTLVRGFDAPNPVPQANKRLYCVLANEDSAVDFTTNHTNIKIENLNFSNPSLYYGCFMSFYYVNKLDIRNIYCNRTVQDWNITVLANNVNMRGIRIEQADNAPIYEDGIHILGGNGINISDCDLKTGDDGIALTTIIGSNIFNVNINNIYVRSNSGNAIRLSNDAIVGETVDVALYRQIRNVNISNISGFSGISKNGGISLYDVIDGRISDISCSNVKLKSGNTFTGVNLSQGIYIKYVKNLIINNCFFDTFQRGIYIELSNDIILRDIVFNTITGVASNTIAPVHVINSNRVNIIALTAPNYTYTALFRINTVTNLTIRDGYFTNLKTNQIGVYLENTNSDITIVNNKFISDLAANIYGIRNYGTTDLINIQQNKFTITAFNTSSGNEQFFNSGTVTNLKSDKLNNSIAYTLPILAAGATITQSVTVGNATIGDLVEASFIGLDATIVNLTAQVTTTNFVLCTFRNFSASPTTAVVGTLNVKIIK